MIDCGDGLVVRLLICLLVGWFVLSLPLVQRRFLHDTQEFVLRYLAVAVTVSLMVIDSTHSSEHKERLRLG